MNATDVVKHIRQSEKTTRLALKDQYVVDVNVSANKIQIQAAVEKLFDVKVLKVNTQNCHGKWRRLQSHWGRKPDWKKAVVTLKKGQKIEFKS